MTKTRVGVLRGGVGHEYDVSLATGGSVLKHLPEENYKPVDLLLSKEGVLHASGIPVDLGELPLYVDVVFNALHGEFGEDGQIQKLLDRIKIPYTGSGHFAGAIGINKVKSKEIFKKNNLKTPYGISLAYDGGDYESYAGTAFRKIPPPWLVKPADRGSSVGVSLAFNFDELLKAIIEAFSVSDNILIEEYITGKEATCGVIDNFRGQDYYSLPPIEIRKPKDSIVWTYDEKYSGETEEICPGIFTEEEKREIEEAALLAHQALGLRHYSRSDFIVSPRGVYILEVNTLPGLTPESLLPKALSAVGCDYGQFLDHVISLALS